MAPPPSPSPPSRLLRLPFPLILALRYLRSTRRDAFTSFLSLVAGGGIALGVLALILALAMLSGLQRALRDDVLARTPEIEVELAAGSDAARARQLALGVAGVEAAQVVVRGRGWLVVGDRVQPVDLLGFDGAVPESFPGAAGGAPGLYLSDSLAARFGLAPGATVGVVSPLPTLTPFGPQPRLRNLPLAGTFAAGVTVERERLALPLRAAESLLGAREHRLLVAAGGLEQALEVAPRLQRALAGGGTVRTWRDLNRPLLFALQLEKLLTFVAVSLVVVVASLALVADLALIIAAKRGEIGILQACGASRTALRQAFLALGALLAGMGVLAGGSLGVAAAWVLDHFRLVSVPGQVYFFNYVPFLVRPADLGAILALTLVLVLASSWYAARRATLLAPVEAMRR